MSRFTSNVFLFSFFPSISLVMMGRGGNKADSMDAQIYQ